MGYDLGVDLGTTYTAAATRRDGIVRIVSLGTHGPVVPSVVFRPDIVRGLAVGVPTPQEWDRGGQELGCFLGLADGSPLTGKRAG